MKEWIKIKYLALMKQSDDTQKIQFECQAFHEWEMTNESWKWDHASYGHMEILLSGSQLTLVNPQNTLVFRLNESTHLEYQTPYGMFLWQGKLLKLKLDRDRLLAVYEIWDQSGCIVHCDLVLTKISESLIS